LITSIESTGQALGRREAMWFALAGLAFVVVEIAAMGAWPMVTRPFWLDEVHTYLVAGTQSFPESMRSLAAGADFNPPAALVLYRVVGLLAGGLSEVAARLAAAACVLGALTTVYILLRDQFSPWTATIATLAVWAQQVVMHAAFEARFYGPWLLASGCLLLALLRIARREPTRASAVWLAVVSIAVCTVHYFGILSWAIGIATVLLFAPRSRAVTVRRLLPSIAGPLALAACMPLYIGQRASLTVPTWIPDVTAIEAARLLARFLLTLPILMAMVCWALAQWRGRRAGVLVTVRAWWAAARVGRIGRPFSLGPALLLAQVAVPFALVAFSLLVQPATEPRYWIVGAFASAPVVALLLSRADVLIRGIAIAGMLTSSVKTLWGESNRAEAFVRRVREDVRVATQLAGSGALVVSRRRDTLYPVLHERPEFRSHTAVLDCTPFDTTNAFSIVERDIARVHRRLYGFPNLVGPAELARVPSFYLVEPEIADAPTSTEFPAHVIRRVGGRVFQLVLRPPLDPVLP
jgi:hypothetical protein